ncbi:tyrosine-type recombinase/integrase [Methanobrevibacter sp.]|uniref:tyrosine-type recombinase/integrase n=1 Tax=Methanobrevibacter sp. TaxID=66852 RepID=UPI00386AA2D7
MNNNELLKNLAISCNHSEETQRIYRLALTNYASYFNQDLDELLAEAEEDENNNIKWKRRRVKAKLTEYRHHLLQKYALNTVKKHMIAINKFYRFYDIEIQKLPMINEKSIQKAQPIYFKDLPDKEIIREAVSIASPFMKAVILFICSSGCGRAETLNLTIQDYIDALSEYVPRRCRNIYEIIDITNEDKNIVPTFNIRRLKTNKYYTTYCSPEAVKAINAYLLTRTDPLTNESKLFKTHPQYLINNFQKINDYLGLGKVGNYNRFRSHMLRKFHASALYNDGMSLDKVNDLQGKSKNKTDQAYFMVNPEDLKYDYIQHLPAVTINKEVEKLSIKSPEFAQMENENQVLKTELDELKSEVSSLNNVQSQIDELRAFKDKMLDLMSSAQYEG